MFIDRINDTSEGGICQIPRTRVRFAGDFYDTIEQKSRDLAALLKFDAGLSKFVTYLFVELIRNVYEHAEIDEVYVAAQKWPSKQELEIAISDAGCGVCESLRHYVPYASKSEKELLQMACAPGISARSNFRYLEKGNSWRNSGYGLYMLRKLSIAYGGSFLLCSGHYALREDAKGREMLETAYHGTTVAIRMKTNLPLAFETVRRDILKQGEAEARSDKYAIHTASKSSGGRY
mgnify:CR=1 FL=1